jgi:hypothetical protein
VVSLVASSFDGSTILTAEWQGATRLWPKDGPPIIVMPASRDDHTKGVSADLTRLVTQGANEGVYLWDMSCDSAELKRRLRAATPSELTPDEPVSVPRTEALKYISSSPCITRFCERAKRPIGHQRMVQLDLFARRLDVAPRFAADS